MKPIKTTAIPPAWYRSRDVSDVIAIAELVCAYLVDQGIEVESFGWSIEIDYVEDEV